MPSLLGLNFLKSKKHPSPAQQQPTEENASNSGYGGRNLAVSKTSEAKKSETHLKLKAKASSEDGYGASSRKEITSAAKPKKKDQAPVNRKNFSTVKNVRQDETFTNNESLPGMEKAYKQFIRLYPEYLNTLIIDEIRAREYTYLDESGHVCLDYSGYGLFSKWQETWHKASASFGLSYISVNLPTHALYGGADEGTAEYDIKKMISEFLNIQESEYAMVFTASRGSAFKLLGESYPFQINKKLLSVYDYESDAVKWIEEAAQKRGAEIVNANFRWPSQRLWATDLKKKILEKQKTKKEPGKGLFVFPVQSIATGAKYSYQWMSQAQENSWDILLDASALGPNAMGSLGLCVFRPDFIVSSFFKVYGSDPTGFGCLMIKRSVIQRLHSSSVARGVGMVRLVPTSLLSDGQPEGVLQEAEIAVHGSLRFTERRWTKSAGTSAGPSQQFSMAQDYSITSELFPKSSGKPAKAGDDKTIPRTSYKHSVLLPKLHRDKGSEASSSTSGKWARQGVRSSSDEGSAHGLSLTKCQQKLMDRMKEVYSFDDYEEVAKLESAYNLGRNDHLRGEDQRNPEESISSADFDGVRECETSRRGTLQQDQLYVQPYVSTSPTIMNGHKDSSIYSEDASVAFFYDDDDDYENASLPFKKNVDDDDADDDDDDAAKSFNFTRTEHEIVCRGLEHAHELGLNGTNTRLRCLINWLIASMLKLRHPGSPDAQRLVQIYGPRVSYDRGASVAFNIFDWKGNLLQPLLVQRLADRSNISFGITNLSHIHLPKSSSNWPSYMEHLNKCSVSRGHADEARCVGKSPSMEVITISLCFLSNFQDVYRFWVFLANFLDADFVSKEVWLYRSLNQETVVLGIEERSKSSSS